MKQKICPLMSTKHEVCTCSEICAWYIASARGGCALPHVVYSLMSVQQEISNKG